MNNNQSTVVITGANRGIGLGLCQYYLQQGWLVLATHRQGALSEPLASLSAEYAKQLILLELDVCDPQSIKQFAATLATQVEQLDVLINNAGVSINADFGQWDQALFLDNFNANVVGPALLIQEVFNSLSTGAKVIQLSSGLASLQEVIGEDQPFDAYALSKAGVNGLTRRLAAKSVSKHHIFCAMSPGWVSTDMGGKDAPTSVTEVAQQMFSTIEGLTLEHSGTFMDSEGNTIPW